VSVLCEWFNSVKNIFLDGGAKIEFKDTGHGSAFVRVEIKTHLMEVCVWDYASCLDSQIMEIESEKIIYPHNGSCENRQDFEFELQEFISAFQKLKPKHA
jgi:hypothetical protein